MKEEKVKCEFCGKSHYKKVMITPDNYIYFCKMCSKIPEVADMIRDFSKKGD